MGAASAQPQAVLPSPAATASVTVAGGTIDIRYNSPQMRGRKIMGGLVPYAWCITRCCRRLRSRSNWLQVRGCAHGGSRQLPLGCLPDSC
jgi:hypothetical protein